MKVAIGLGASIGPRRSRLELTLRQLNADPHLHLLRASRWVRTPPMRGGSATGWFLNGVALFEASCSPHELLDKCVALEHRAGRRRAHHWGDRTLDIDLLMAEGVSVQDPRLTLPHPALHSRPFVCEPLREVWPEAMGECQSFGHPRPVMVGVVASGRPPAYLAFHRRPPLREGAPRTALWSSP